MLKSTYELTFENSFPTFLENPTQVQLLSCPTASTMKVEGSLGSLIVMASTSPSMFSSLYSLNIHVVYPIDFLLNFLDPHSRFLLESELLIEEYLPAEIHISVLAYPKFGKAIEMEVPSFLHKVPI